MFVVLNYRKAELGFMNNLLELVENKEDVAVAAAYEDIANRKEVYVKSLILSALKKSLNCIQTENSLFYSMKFYALTKLFDFYIKNNVFDLIVLKPASDELLFDALNDDIHTNIYGYVVVRVDETVEKAEILGYFMSKDYEKTISNGVLDVSLLKDVGELKDIEELESQMSLEDVSDRFFELVSKFLDDEINPSAQSELACLLYNSAELRQVFAELGRFDNLCVDIKDNKELLQDDFLSVFGPKDEEELEEEDVEELELETLTVSDDEEPKEIDAEDIDLGLDLSTFSSSENESEEGLEKEQEDILNTSDELEELSSIDVQNEDVLPDVELPLIEAEDEAIKVENENLLPELDDLDIVESLQGEDLELKDLSEDPDLPSDGSELEADFDELISSESELESLAKEDVQRSEEKPSVVENAELEARIEDEDSVPFEEVDLDGLEDFESEESESSKEDLATNESEISQQIKVESSKTSTVADDELMSILGNDLDDNVVVDEDEFLSILGMDETETGAETEIETETEAETAASVRVDSSLMEEKPLSEPETEILSDVQVPTSSDNEVQLQEEHVEDVTEESDKELTVLYTDEDTTSAGTFPGDGIVKFVRKQKTSIAINKKVVMAATLLVLAVGGSSLFLLNKNNDAGNDSVAQLPQTSEPQNADDNFSLPTVPQDDSEIGGDMPFDAVPQESQADVSNSGETKIVSSLSRQAGAAPVILKSVAWQVPASMTSDVVFSKYLQIAGKNIKLNLAADLLGTDDFAYNNKIKVSMTVKNNSPVKNVKIIESSGSKDVDDIVLQSIKQTLKYINSPVMSTDTEDKDVVLVISI